VLKIDILFGSEMPGRSLLRRGRLSITKPPSRPFPAGPWLHATTQWWAETLELDLLNCDLTSGRHLTYISTHGFLRGRTADHPGGEPMARFGLLLPPVLLCCSLFAQNPPQSHPRALTFATQAIAAPINGIAVPDVTLSGDVVRTSGTDTANGTATQITKRFPLDLHQSPEAHSHQRNHRDGLLVSTLCLPRLLAADICNLTFVISTPIVLRSTFKAA